MYQKPDLGVSDSWNRDLRGSLFAGILKTRIDSSESG
jgi:hypothetical protein